MLNHNFTGLFKNCEYLNFYISFCPQLRSLYRILVTRSIIINYRPVLQTDLHAYIKSASVSLLLIQIAGRLIRLASKLVQIASRLIQIANRLIQIASGRGLIH